MRGPIDYIVIDFTKPSFEGRVLDELRQAEDAGTIAVLALALVEKQADGSVQELSVDEERATFVSILPDNAFIGDDDVQEVGSLLEPESAAGLIIIEHLWAIGLKQAIIDTGGVLVAEGRIHPDAADELDLEVAEEV